MALKEFHCYDGYGQEEAADKDYFKRRVEELEAAIHRECTKCFGADCDIPTCPLYPYRGGE